MNANIENNLARLCLHTITNKPWTLDMAVNKYRDAGIHGISVWRYGLEGKNPETVGAILEKSGLKVVSLVRGGFFTGLDESQRKQAIEDNLKMIDEASAINAGMLVLVCGSTPGQTLETSRLQIEEGIRIILPSAEKKGIQLAIEPLHPVYADTRSAINTMKQANDLVEKFQSPYLGVAVDLYHVWWDPDLEQQILRCGKNKNLFAVHLCDWRVPTRDILNDRELMGRGIIPVQEIINWTKEAGFNGMYEVEIFSNVYWQQDQDRFLADIVESFNSYTL